MTHEGARLETTEVVVIPPARRARRLRVALVLLALGAAGAIAGFIAR